MFACICRAVTEDEVRDHRDNGATTPDAVGERCGAGEGCGTCVQRLTEILNEGMTSTTAA